MFRCRDMFGQSSFNVGPKKRFLPPARGGIFQIAVISEYVSKIRSVTSEIRHQKGKKKPQRYNNNNNNNNGMSVDVTDRGGRWFVVFTEDQEELTPGLGSCGWTLTIISWLLIGLTFPVSLCICLKVITASFIVLGCHWSGERPEYTVWGLYLLLNVLPVCGTVCHRP